MAGIKHYYRVRLGLIAVLALVLLAAAGCGANGGPANGEQRGVVTLGVNHFNDALMPALIIELGLEDAGYTVERRELLELSTMFLALDQGDVDIYSGFWLPTFHANYVERYGDSIAEVGNLHKHGTPIGWIIPDYTAEEHGITSIPDLKGKDDVFRGRVYGYEAGTGGTEKSLEALDVYGLDEYQFVPSSVPAMLTELQTSINLNQPVITLGWRPHWMFARLPVVLLEDPEDVFGAAREHISAAVNRGFMEEHPEVVTFLENFHLPIEDTEAMLYEIEEENADVEAMMREWYEANKETVASWWN